MAERIDPDQAVAVLDETEADTGNDGTARQVLSFAEANEGKICALGIELEGGMPLAINDAWDSRSVPTGGSEYPGTPAPASYEG